MKPQYIIIGGVNGAGKSTLYRTNPKIFGATRRLNADEKLRAAGGDWRNPADAARAMRDTVQDLRQALAAGESIHQETTLAGNAKSFQNLIDRAHAQGYEVTLLYVTLNSADTAVDRVAARVAKGGHGVDEADIRRRYDSSHANLQVLASLWTSCGSSTTPAGTSRCTGVPVQRCCSTSRDTVCTSANRHLPTSQPSREADL